MTLTVRKIVVISLIGFVFLMGNILVIANWMADKGVQEKANWIQHEFLTGTAVAVIIALLILLVGPRTGRSLGIARKCPVCDKKLMGNVNYCGECGSKV